MENRSPIFLSLAAAAALAACATDGPLSAAVVATPVVSSPAIAYPADTAAAAPSGVWVQTAVALRPGVARVEAILPMVDNSGPIRRLSLRMEDGSLQVADIRGPRVALGARVEITRESYILYRVATL